MLIGNISFFLFGVKQQKLFFFHTTYPTTNFIEIINLFKKTIFYRTVKIPVDAYKR